MLLKLALKWCILDADSVDKTYLDLRDWVISYCELFQPREMADPINFANFVKTEVYRCVL